MLSRRRLVVKSFQVLERVLPLRQASCAVSHVTLPCAFRVRPSVCVATLVRSHLWIIRTTCSYFSGTEPLSSELGEIKTGTSLSVMNHCLKMWRRLKTAGPSLHRGNTKGICFVLFLVRFLDTTGDVTQPLSNALRSLRYGLMVIRCVLFTAVILNELFSFHSSGFQSTSRSFGVYWWSSTDEPHYLLFMAWKWTLKGLFCLSERLTSAKIMIWVI